MGDAAVQLQEAVNRWQSSVAYMQQHANTANAFIEANPQFAQTPLNYGSAVNNAQQWLDAARQALATQDQGVIRAALETSRNAWRGVDPNGLAASRQAITQVVPQLAQQAVPIGEVLAAEAPVIQQAAVPIGEALAAELPVIVANAEQNAPQLITAGAGAGASAAAAGLSWTAILAGGAVIVLLAAGGYVLYRNATNSKPSTPSVQAAPQGAGALPDPGLSGPEPTPSATLDDAPSTPEVVTPVPAQTPVPTPVAQPEPVAAPAPPPSPNPAPNPTPGPTPQAQCALPNSIGVTGGDHSSLGPSGGSFTVTSTPVVLSADPVDCGSPYRMGFNASGSSGTTYGSDCEPHRFSYDISSGSSPVRVGDSVAVTLEAPPNSCPQN